MTTSHHNRLQTGTMPRKQCLRQCARAERFHAWTQGSLRCRNSTPPSARSDRTLTPSLSHGISRTDGSPLESMGRGARSIGWKGGLSHDGKDLFHHLLDCSSDHLRDHGIISYCNTLPHLRRRSCTSEFSQCPKRDNNINKNHKNKKVIWHSITQKGQSHT